MTDFQVIFFPVLGLFTILAFNPVTDANDYNLVSDRYFFLIYIVLYNIYIIF